MAKMLTKGTKNKTPEQLENAIESLGASINAFATDESFSITGNTLAKNYQETINLVQEIILEPRWDAKEFELLKQSILSQIERQKAMPNSIAANEYAKLIYGEGNILANNNSGTETSVNSISIDDLKAFYETNISPSVTNFHIVGAVTAAEVIASLAELNDAWEVKDVTIPKIETPAAPESSQVYFYDVPGAKQSVIRFGYPALAVTDNDYYPLTMVNYRLGGGGFASQLTQQLREGKGYTYGIRSGFSGTTIKGPFTISSNVRSNVTFESARLVKEILSNYAENYNENDLEVTKSYLIKSNARAFETLRSKLNMLRNISNYNFADDYAKQRENIVKDMTVEEVKILAEKYLDPTKMIYLFVGDAETQLSKLEQLGFGKPILLNK
jgi:zinc protease